MCAISGDALDGDWCVLGRMGINIKRMIMEDTKNIYQIGLTWLHHTLIVIGFISAVCFIRVNFFDAKLELNFPEYRTDNSMAMNDHGPVFKGKR